MNGRFLMKKITFILKTVQNKESDVYIILTLQLSSVTATNVQHNTILIIAGGCDSFYRRFGLLMFVLYKNSLLHSKSIV